MTCRHCSATIAAKALICYRCGNATTEPRIKPSAEGSLFARPKRRVPLWLWVLIAALLVALAVFAYTQDMLMAQGAGRYADLQRAALAGQGPAVTVREVIEPAIRESVARGITWGGGVLGLGVVAAIAIGRGSRFLGRGLSPASRGGPEGPPNSC